MRLVYLSPVKWSSFAQRPHKFVTWFQREQCGQVLWIDPYPTRLPSLSDLRRLGKSEAHDNKSNPEWLTVLTPTSFPIEPIPGCTWFNSWKWRGILQTVGSFTRQQKCLVAVGKPSALALSILDQNKTCRSIYDAMDDFPAFYSGLSRYSMRSREQQLVKRVDTVLASSTAIRRRWSGFNNDVRLVHNAVDSGAIPPYPGKSNNNARKVFGYVGTIASWFDWDWVIALADAHATEIVRLIGPVFTPVPENLPTNVELLPSCSHQEALQSMRQFDVGLIPFKNNDLTAAVDPIKYYEYRALGLPVVSTAFGEMALRSEENCTFLSPSEDNIKTAITKALLHRASEESVRQFSVDNSWEKRFASAGIV